MKNIAPLICISALIVFSSTSSCAQNTTEKEIRIDTPVTASNSALYDLGDGVRLRIPMTVVGLTPERLKEIKQPISWDMPIFNLLSFTYPEMTQSRYAPETDTDSSRFSVWMRWLFYSPEGTGMTAPDEPRNVYRVRPSRMLLNSKIGFEEAEHPDKHYKRSSEIPPYEPTIVKSKYPGLIEVRFPETERIKKYRSDDKKIIKQNGGNERYADVREPIFVAEEDATYELYMRCEVMEDVSDKCAAEIFSKSTHFQYRIEFSYAAISRTDELVRAINRLLTAWAKT